MNPDAYARQIADAYPRRLTALSMPASTGLAADPQLAVPGIVPKLSRTPGEHRRLAPGIGQDTDAVLAEIGLTPQQIAELKRRGVVAGGAP